MISGYGGTKHKCIVIPFMEFRGMMNDLYGITPTETGSDSMDLLWRFDDNDHFKLCTDVEWIIKQCNLPTITLNDISECLLVGDIIDIVADTTSYNDRDRANIYIIYD
jgi:hypothetical protein